MINVLDKITEMRIERNWTEYQLAEKSGLTQSTISSWYRKNTLPTLPSLEKICDAFGTSLSAFLMESNDQYMAINPEQLELLLEISKLTSNQQHLLLNFIKSFNS